MKLLGECSMRVGLRILESLLLIGRMLPRTTKTFFILFWKDGQFSFSFFFFHFNWKGHKLSPKLSFLNNKNVLSACNGPVKHRTHK